jgi:L-lactate dehydrogenase complex protein LldG
MNRTDFLARLKRSQAKPDAEPAPRAWPRPKGPDAAAEFITRAQAAGAVVTRAGGPEKAADAVVDILRRAGVGRAGWAGLEPELADHLAKAAEADSLELLEVADGRTDAVETSEALAAGITRAELAVAELGALVQCSGDQGGRLLSLLPPLHIALLRVSDLVYTLADLSVALTDPARFPLGPPTGLALIAGPSKTADIEAVMVAEVHGPGRVEIVLWD